MKTSTSQKFRWIAFLGLLMICSTTAYSQVGINTTTPAQMLDVNGNVKIDGALMPNNLAGTAGQLLESGGPGNPNTWGANLYNVTDIARYGVVGPTLSPNTVTSLTVGITGVTTQSTAIITIVGNWSSDIYDDLTIHNIEMRTNEVRFAVSNNTPGIGGVTYPTVAYNITIIR